MKPYRKLLCLLIVALLYLNSGIFVAMAKTEAEEKIVPILMYHNIVDDIAGHDPSANIEKENFKSHIRAILRAGYTPVKLSDYCDAVKNDKPLPEKPIVVTFDDGYASNYWIAYPFLREFDFPATIFVVTESVGMKANGQYYEHFTWKQAKEMDASGIIDIQSHTHSHKNMGLLSRGMRNLEFRLSKYLIEKNLGKECKIFAYPYGSYDQETYNLGYLAGYEVQLKVYDTESSEDYLANSTKDGLENLTRLTISNDLDSEELIEFIRQAEENTKNKKIEKKITKTLDNLSEIE